ncbi:SOS response-associated peptidase [Rhodococcus sp. 11-3]|nr:SOS response-associated peptidase [Rhodococcus sp. 11-3]
MRWGTVPSFAAEIDRSATLFNARSESAELEPAFARPVRHRRCLVPTDGWYEWQHDPSSADGRAGPAGKAGRAGRIRTACPRGTARASARPGCGRSGPIRSRAARRWPRSRSGVCRPWSAASATTVSDCSPRPRPPPSSSPCSDARRRIRPRW